MKILEGEIIRVGKRERFLKLVFSSAIILSCRRNLQGMNLISNVHDLFNVYLKLSKEENQTKCKKMWKIVELVG